MATFLLPTLAVAAVTLLVVAGVGHLRHPAALRSALEAQRLPARGLVARALGPVELLVALSALVTGVAVTAIGIGFLVVLLVLLRRETTAPCGCDGGADPVAPVDLGRAALVTAGGVALLAGLPDLSGPEWATVLLAGVGLALAVDLAARSQAPAVAA
jgi:hypothetical protein